MRDIFDFTDVADLPKEIQERFTKKPKNVEADNIIQLLELANAPLSIDQIIAAYYRKFGVACDRRRMTGKLYHMAKKELISSNGWGVYAALNTHYGTMGGAE